MSRIDKKGKILALDYGMSRIGAAVSDEEQTMAFGRGFIDCKKGLNNLFEKIYAWCKEDNITTVVVGLPLNENAEETPQTRRIRSFAKKLGHFLVLANLRVAIVFEDESFTSFEAATGLAELGFAAKKSKKHQDELAAVLILKRYLKAQNF